MCLFFYPGTVRYHIAYGTRDDVYHFGVFSAGAGNHCGANPGQYARTGQDGEMVWGNTPTGFRSEGVSNVTIDGKTRKSYMLVPVEEEAQLVRTVFALYKETDSLTAVEAELIRCRLKTKQGKNFTRFAVKAILQNPVYMVADQAAYQYFAELQAEVCFPEEEFDGSCGIMAYNRTDQEKGKATIVYT